MVCDGAARAPHAKPARKGPRPEAALASGDAGADRRRPGRHVVRGDGACPACRAYRPGFASGAHPPARGGQLGPGRPGRRAGRRRGGAVVRHRAGGRRGQRERSGRPAGRCRRGRAGPRAAAPGLARARPGSPSAQAGPASASPRPGSPGAQPAGTTVRAAVAALHPRAVLAVGIPPASLSAQLSGIREIHGVRVITNPARLPATRAPAPLRHVVLLVHQGGPGAASTAAAATAQAAGARVVAVRGYDPRADPAAIAALAAASPRQVLAVGGRFGPPGLLAARVAAAETGVQLPGGGGEIVVPARRLVALYGHPGTPSLGALGQQGLTA